MSAQGPNRDRPAPVQPACGDGPIPQYPGALMSQRKLVGPGIVASLALVFAACTAASSSHSSRSAPSTTSTSTTTTTTSTTTTPTPPTFPSGIQVGPGPQATYTIQPQPAPRSCHYGYSGSYPLPDPRCTPGAINPQVTQVTIASTICSPGYTASIRPPESVTEPEKVGSADAYGYMGSLHTAEYDHLISLELGGDPNDPANLWVEPNDRAGAATTYNTKDTLENTLKRLVCSGQMTLAAARQAIATNWVAAYQQFG
jgi:hypothetical protein